jgi:hypothetical protein
MLQDNDQAGAGSDHGTPAWYRRDIFFRSVFRLCRRGAMAGGFDWRAGCSRIQFQGDRGPRTNMCAKTNDGNRCQHIRQR